MLIWLLLKKFCLNLLVKDWFGHNWCVFVIVVNVGYESRVSILIAFFWRAQITASVVNNHLDFPLWPSFTMVFQGLDRKVSRPIHRVVKLGGHFSFWLCFLRFFLSLLRFDLVWTRSKLPSLNLVLTQALLTAHEIDYLCAISLVGRARLLIG